MVDYALEFCQIKVAKNAGWLFSCMHNLIINYGVDQLRE